MSIRDWAWGGNMSTHVKLNDLYACVYVCAHLCCVCVRLFVLCVCVCVYVTRELTLFQACLWHSRPAVEERAGGPEERREAPDQEEGGGDGADGPERSVGGQRGVLLRLWRRPDHRQPHRHP